MPESTDMERVEILEHKVQVLEMLPARVSAVELRILQLRQDMHAEFSAVRQEMATIATSLREEIRAGDEETRRYMRVLHDEIIEKIKAIGEGRGTKRK